MSQTKEEEQIVRDLRKRLDRYLGEREVDVFAWLDDAGEIANWSLSEIVAVQTPQLKANLMVCTGFGSMNEPQHSTLICWEEKGDNIYTTGPAEFAGLIVELPEWEYENEDDAMKGHNKIVKALKGGKFSIRPSEYELEVDLEAASEEFGGEIDGDRWQLGTITFVIDNDAPAEGRSTGVLL